MMKPWEMILSHRYAEAVAQYESQLLTNPDDPGLLSAHATGLLNLGRLDEALAGFVRANHFADLQLRGETQPYLTNIGTILWLLGRREEAISSFMTGADGIAKHSIKFTDFAGGASEGLLLWYAGISTENDTVKSHALTFLTKLSKKARIKNWPGSLALFVLGKKTRADVLVDLCGTNDLDEATSQATGNLLTRRGLVKALFYFATRSREEGHEDEFHSQMSRCARTENPVLEEEWYLAQAECAKTSQQKI